jgi:glycosyltransferase involved in cell wall biosynthesis
MTGASGGEGSVLLAFPSSNQNVRADVAALQRAGMLAAFCTTIAWQRGSLLSRLLPASLRQELERRAFEGVDPRRIRTFPLRELVRQGASRLGLSALARHETGWASVDAVSRSFDARVARLIRSGRIKASAVYAYDYAALGTFEAAAAVGMRRFYELPTGYWRAGKRLLEEERELSPEWAATMEILADSPAKQARKDAELAAAERIVVPSGFVRETLGEHPGLTAEIAVIPYGAPPPALPAERRPAGELRVLYVGHLSQQKGISYLFAAMRELRGAAQLTLVGGKAGGRCPALDAELDRHEWLGPVPHARVLEVMREHDVLVFPSLFEGFGLVILEAMAQGLPVVATANTAGPEVIEEGVDGFVVPIRDPLAIARRVLDLARDRDRLAAMSAAALRKAARMSWQAREVLFIRALRGWMGAESD